METTPLVSYVVVTHDRPANLVRDRIIKSVLRQTYPRKELILVGEQCPRLGEIADGLSDLGQLDRFSAINVERPSGEKMCVWALVARARNAGIRVATGEYISCQDDDNELVPQFTERMLETAWSTNSLTVWCWRQVLEPDGQLFSGDYFPWIEGDELRRQILYEIWTKAKVIQPGSCIVQDTFWAEYRGEPFSTVDPNEWLVHRDVYRLIPYHERYTHNEIAYHVTFDDIWDEALRKSGLRVACWKEPGLIYYLGGASNSAPREVNGA